MRFSSAVLSLLALVASVSTSCAAPAPVTAPSSTTSATSPLRVRTSKGIVVGYAGSDSNRFTVPYALPPTGTRRFQAPQALTAFTLYDATQLPNACAQNPNTPAAISSTSEDCLYVNIYTPPGSINSSANLPVFVWLHGGSFYAGSSTMSGLDGTTLVNSQNMLVVTVQYRLGVLGFLKNDAIGISGNNGLRDVIAALSYIQTEIAGFGGNPNSITLAGQSSGAELVKTLLTTPSATSLFHRAIMQSPPLGYGDHSIATANSLGALIANDLSCTTLQCMQSATVSQILSAQNDLFDSSSAYYAGNVAGVAIAEPLRPVVDGTLVTRKFGQVSQTHGALEGTKPIILSSVQDEACSVESGLVSFSALLYPLSSRADQHHFFRLVGYPSYYMEPIMDEFFGSSRTQTLLNSGLYPINASDANTGLANALLPMGTDAIWCVHPKSTTLSQFLKSLSFCRSCPIQQSAVNLTSSATPIYLAQFNIGIPYANATISYCNDKVNHQDDIYATFGNPPSTLSRNQIVMMREVLARWGAFARTGSPNTDTYGSWTPISSATSLNTLVLGGGRNGASAFASTVRTPYCQVGTGIWGRLVPFDEQLYL
ncbi:alpha/beta-hydrolase [Meredithblackwellia eburnea MCA 4105]